jgi:hypothetical protein
MKKLIITGALAVLAACQGQLLEPGGEGSGGPGGPGGPSGSGGGPGPNNGPNGKPGDPGTDPGRQPPGTTACNTLNPGESPVRRLSNAEYRNTIIDLIGDTALADQITSGFVSETESLGYRNSAKFLLVNTVNAQHFMDAAEEIAKKIRATPASVLPCTPTAGSEKACATQFINEFGKKVYRRPLTAEEVAKYEALYDKADKDYTFQVGIEWIAFTMLQSPNFLNRVEFAPAPVNGATYTRPTHYEMASRLSYLIWQSMPDQVLFDAAAANQLGTDAEIAAQARRMLADPKAKRVYQFFQEWMDVDELPAMERDNGVYPSYTDKLPGLLAQEAKAFIDDVLWTGAGDFKTLMTAPYSFVNAELATHYGISGVTGTNFRKVSTPGRGGFLTLGGVVSVHDKPTRSSIVLRGLRVRTEILCHIVGAPPADIVLDLPEVAPGLPQAKRLEAHRTEALCASCHDKMDPLGVPFENFDAMGRLRTMDEEGNPVETAGAITHTDSPDVTVANASELSSALADSKEVRECFTKQAFRFFYGRGEAQADTCSLAQLNSAFEKSNYSIPELLVSLTQTDAFLYRPTSVQP